MKPHQEHIEEYPNLNYIKELCGSDLDFEQKFIATLKEEFARQLGNYLYHVKKAEPRAASEVVHRIKDKFNILGMKKTFDFAENYQEKLELGDMSLDNDFKEALKKVNEFLKLL